MKRDNALSATTSGIKITKIYTHDFVGIKAEVRDFGAKKMAAPAYMQFIARRNLRRQQILRGSNTSAGTV
jgi:hypothetical protein